MSEAVSLEFELTPEEWITAQSAHFKELYIRRGDVTRLQSTVAGVFGLIAVAGTFLGLWMTTMVWAGIGFLYWNLIPRQVEKQTKAQLEKTAQEGIIPGLFGRHRLELREEGVLDITDGYECLTRWSTVEGVEHIDGMFIIYTGPNSFITLPESAFRGPEELRAFSDAFHTLRGLHAEEALTPPEVAQEATRTLQP